MDKAKAAVQNLVSKSGHHDTTVHESVAPAVTHETVNKQHHEDVQKAVDREVHQDHYHTTVQPVKDKEILPEQHSHRQAATEHHEHHHGKDRAIADSLKQERAHFHDQTTSGSTTETHSTLPTVHGEHKHHHVHETIQPVVQKETIQPSVIHTTVPVHEVHHNDPKHHAASALPAVSMADFKKQGGSLTGRNERSDAFAGEPNTLASTGSASAIGSGSHGNATGPHNSNLLNKADPRVDSDRDGSSNAGLAQHSAPLTGHGSSTGATGYGSGTTGTHGAAGTGLGGNVGTAGTTSGPHNSNLANKADPRVDSDRDGSRGLSSTGGYGSSTTGTGLGSGTTGTHGTTGLGSGTTGTHGTSGLGSGTTGTHGTSGLGSGTTGSYGTGAGPHDSNLANKADPRIDSTTGTSTNTSTTTSTAPKKVSLLDKLNPKKDADGDGKPGFFK